MFIPYQFTKGKTKDKRIKQKVKYIKPKAIYPSWLPSDYHLSTQLHPILATFFIQTVPLDTFCIQDHP